MSQKPTHELIESAGSSVFDDDDYETDSDYEDIQIASWGDNAKKEPATWDSLIDSNIKIKAGGVGSGDLHRRGGNYKPISEEHILAQRLKKPIPGSGASKTKKKKPKKKKPTSLATVSAARTKPNRPYVPLPIKTVPIRERAPPTQSAWSTTNLSSEPFWEQQKRDTASSGSASQPPKTTFPLQQRLIAQPNTRVTRSTSQPAWASFAATVDQPAHKFTNLMATPSLSSQPSSKYATPPSSLPQTNQSTPVAKPSPLPSEPSALKPASIDSTRHKPHIHLDKTSIHKHLLTPSTKLNQPKQPQSKQQEQHQQQQQQHQHQQHQHQQLAPLVEIDINIAPGISTILHLYKDSDPQKIAEEFGPKHGLNVTQSAKEGIAKTLRRVLDAIQHQN
ncbi:hypothetical protein A0J61_04482 [Choanephora cucurbitarum]|uniref:Uncharacterized protein n=1 Tax=Choanephora cucurbitarum TaxID=101091 RepID=A0A1C7NEE2_9FUNG|nr:hypothetical protein A0J61_04482 [Choanephora cucurbitarum]